MEAWYKMFERMNEKSKDHCALCDDFDKKQDIKNDIIKILELDISPDGLRELMYDVIRNYDIINLKQWKIEGFDTRRSVTPCYGFGYKRIKDSGEDRILTRCIVLKEGMGIPKWSYYDYFNIDKMEPAVKTTNFSNLPFSYKTKKGDNEYYDCVMLRDQGGLHEGEHHDKLVTGTSLAAYDKDGFRRYAYYTDPGLKKIFFHNLFTYTGSHRGELNETHFTNCVMLRDTDNFKRGENVECLTIEDMKFWLVSDDKKEVIENRYLTNLV